MSWFGMLGAPGSGSSSTLSFVQQGLSITCEHTMKPACLWEPTEDSHAEATREDIACPEAFPCLGQGLLGTSQHLWANDEQQMHTWGTPSCITHQLSSKTESPLFEPPGTPADEPHAGMHSECRRATHRNAWMHTGMRSASRGALERTGMQRECSSQCVHAHSCEIHP
eukprot:743168-Pelagomonas_calceolata.AAC.4